MRRRHKTLITGTEDGLCVGLEGKGGGNVVVGEQWWMEGEVREAQLGEGGDERGFIFVVFKNSEHSQISIHNPRLVKNQLICKR